jgi:hypothetical protein
MFVTVSERLKWYRVAVGIVKISDSMYELKFMSQNDRERLPDLEEADIQEVLKSHAAVSTEGTSNNRQRSLNPKMKVPTLLWRGLFRLPVL